jgi:hypothetical protein
MSSSDYSTVLYNGESLIITRHNHGRPDAEELSVTAQRYIVNISNGKTTFYDPTSNTFYNSPSALCVAKLTRNGNTNCYAGPRHCLIQRNGEWVTIKTLMNN